MSLPRTAGALPPPMHELQRPPRFRALREAGANLVGGVRLLLLGTGHERFHLTSDQAPMLLLVGVLTILTLDVSAAEAGGYFNVYGLALLLAKYLLLGVACHALAVLHARRRGALALFIMLAAMVPPLLVAAHIVDSVLGESAVNGWLTTPATALVAIFGMTLLALSPVYTALESPRPIEARAGKTFVSSLALAVVVWGVVVLVPSEAIWESWKSRRRTSSRAGLTSRGHLPASRRSSTSRCRPSFPAAAASRSCSSSGLPDTPASRSS